MKTIFQALLPMRQDRRAVTALEYGLIAATVVAVGLGAFSAIGTSLSNTVGGIENAMDSDAAPST